MVGHSEFSTTRWPGQVEGLSNSSFCSGPRVAGWNSREWTHKGEATPTCPVATPHTCDGALYDAGMAERSFPKGEGLPEEEGEDEGREGGVVGPSVRSWRGEVRVGLLASWRLGGGGVEVARQQPGRNPHAKASPSASRALSHHMR